MHYLTWEEYTLSAISMQRPPALQIGLLNLGLRFWLPHVASLLLAIKATTTMAKLRNFILFVFKFIRAKQNQNYYLSFLLGVKVGNGSIWQKLGAFYSFWHPPCLCTKKDELWELARCCALELSYFVQGRRNIFEHGKEAVTHFIPNTYGSRTFGPPFKKKHNRRPCPRPM